MSPSRRSGRDGDAQNNVLMMVGRFEQTLDLPLTDQWFASRIDVTAYREERKCIISATVTDTSEAMRAAGTRSNAGSVSHLTSWCLSVSAWEDGRLSLVCRYRISITDEIPPPNMFDYV
jgi:hypothetical protein